MRHYPRERRLSASDTELLQWGLAQGVRTGVSFRIRLTHCRYTSINFYTGAARSVQETAEAMHSLFLIGHQINERLEPQLPRGPESLLSRRERECLDLVAQGLANREIANVLGLSLDTVKEHIRGLFQKLDVNNRAQAVTRGYALAHLG